MNISLIGRSGCGKGTQAKLIIEHFGNLFYISSGDLFRDLAKQGTVTSVKIKEIMESGGLPFDEIATTLWMHKIAYNLKEGQGFLLDGAPRRLDEAKVFNKFVNFLGQKENTFNILIDISRQEAFNRLTKRRICKKCGQLIPWVGDYKKLEKCDQCQGELITRPDDTEEAINNRLDYFDERVTEVTDYFEQSGNLIKINGEQSIEDVFKEILQVLDK